LLLFRKVIALWRSIYPKKGEGNLSWSLSFLASLRQGCSKSSQRQRRAPTLPPAALRCLRPTLPLLERERKASLFHGRRKDVGEKKERSGMGDRVVQGTSLENWRTPKSTVGSNPTPSEGPSQEREGGVSQRQRRASKSVEVKGG
jgi:hypothetical protein